MLQTLRCPYELSDAIQADYIVNQSTCALFLSLRYHRLHPEYIYQRMKALTTRYRLQLLLVWSDIDDPRQPLRELSKLCILNQYTLLVGWSSDEIARLLEAYRSMEHKTADSLKERVDNSYLARATNFLTAVKGVNKTDVVTLLSAFGSIKNIVAASEEELSMIPGFGRTKAKKLYQVFRQPFMN